MGKWGKWEGRDCTGAHGEEVISHWEPTTTRPIALVLHHAHTEGKSFRSRVTFLIFSCCPVPRALFW